MNYHFLHLSVSFNEIYESPKSTFTIANINDSPGFVKQ